MPISIGAPIRRMGDDEFKGVVYDVMGHVFAVHHELGRLFEEKIYQRELACRVAEARTEVPVHVAFERFCKTYFLDLLVAGGAVFELKAVEALAERHRAQLLHYLFLADLPHGKLVNMRTERVQHEFLNAPLGGQQRRTFDVEDGGWQEIDGCDLKRRMLAVLCDWGTGLEMTLYEEVASHLCGRGAESVTAVEVRVDGRSLGPQPVRFAAAETALRVTCLPPERLAEFEAHLRQFLRHTALKSVQWINVARPVVRFKTVRRS